MSNSSLTPTREAVRVKVKKCDPNAPPEWRKFSIDPQITTLEVLYSLLAKAFELKSDFSIKYKAYDPAGNEIYLAVLSDWDLDAAFLRVHNLSIQTSSEPCLTLHLNVKPYTEFKEWESTDVSSLIPNTNATVTGILNTTAREIMSPFQQSLGVSQKYMQQMHNKLPGLIMNQMEKTFSMVQKAFNLSEETMAALPPRPALSDNEFRLFLDALGQIQRTDELRKVIFFGGIDPSLRRVVWKHILNVYPSGMNGHQRMDYMRRKSEQYYKLRASWMKAVKEGCTMGELSYVTNMVRKDVLRTDRLHTFYAGNDDNENVASLFNILTTYALNHPSVSYCQGMSDIASPLLVTMNDEAHAYICFCAIMKRVRGNFMLDGIAMTRKFAHLTEALSFYDPEFWEYLKLQQADDLLFCYRWLLLELKREFPFEDSLRMLEVQWSSLKYNRHLDKELMLYEKEFTSKVLLTTPCVATDAEATQTQEKLLTSVIGTKPTDLYQINSTYRMENAYANVCALRRQKSSSSLISLNGNQLPLTSESNNKLYLMKRLNQSLDDKILANTITKHYYPRRTTKPSKSLDEMKIQQIIRDVNDNRDDNKQSIKLEMNSNEIKVNDIQIDDNTDDDDNDVLIGKNLYEFHDTNPFKSYALSSNIDVCKDTITNYQVPKAFLNSSSSSSSSENCATSDVVCDLTSRMGTSTVGDHCSVHDYEKGTDKMPPMPVPVSVPITIPTTHTYSIPKSIAKLQNKNVLSNYQAVSNIIARQLAHASNVNETIKRARHTGGNHFKDLKEKIAATNRKSRSYLQNNFQNEITAATTVTTTATLATSLTEATTTKLGHVQNLNEHLNLATIDKNSLRSMEQPLKSIMTITNGSDNDNGNKYDEKVNCVDSENHNDFEIKIQQPLIIHPLVRLSSDDLSKDSLGDSDSTSMPNITPTRATTITHQQHHNVCSNNFVNLEMNPSLTSTTHTHITSRTLPLECTKILPKSVDEAVINNIPNIQHNFHSKNCKTLDNFLFHGNNVLHDNDRPHNTKWKNSNFNEIEYKKLDHHDSLDDTAYLQKEILIENVKIEERRSRTSNYITGKNAFKGSNENHFDSIESCSSSLLQADNVSDNVIDNFVELAQEEPQQLQSEQIQSQLQQQQQQCNDDECNISHTAIRQLPSPTEFGDGNPFLIFLCLTLLLQHRNTIMRANMDYNEIAMHFDKMVRRHDVTRVLNQARRMYIDYLKMQATYKQQPQQPQGQQQQHQLEAEPEQQKMINVNATQQIAK